MEQKCKVCELTFSLDKFYFRKDTQKYELTCKKCRNQKCWQRNKNGLVNHRTKFEFKCINCQEQKISKDFYFKNKKTERYDTTCKTCRKTDAISWHQDNRDKSIENKKNWHITNRDDSLQKMKANHRRRMESDPEKERECRRRWNRLNREQINTRRRERYNTDVNFKISMTLRGGCSRIIKRSNKKHCKTMDLLDCSVKFVREWLESQFTEDMTWENHASYWEIDHFLPVACFDLSNLEEQMKCFHWTNLQPLEKKRNRNKSAKIPSEKEKKRHYRKVDKYIKNQEVEKSIPPETKGSVSG